MILYQIFEIADLSLTCMMGLQNWPGFVCHISLLYSTSYRIGLFPFLNEVVKIVGGAYSILVYRSIDCVPFEV